MAKKHPKPVDDESSVPTMAMPDPLAQRITARIEQIKTERNKLSARLIQQANIQLAPFNTAIAELTALLPNTPADKSAAPPVETMTQGNTEEGVEGGSA